MQQRDYILRLIEQMGAALVALRNRIMGRKDDPIAIWEELSGLAGQAGIDLTLLRGFSVDTLHMFVSPGGEVEPARCWLMAELLYLDALQAELEGRMEDATAGFEKAHTLFHLVAPAGGLLIGLPEAAGRMAEIEERLASIDPDRPIPRR
jgi:hypothetical protein